MAIRMTHNEAVDKILSAADSTLDLGKSRIKELNNWFRVVLPDGSVAKLSAGYYVFWPLDTNS